MPFESVKVPISGIVDFESGELRAIRFKLPDDIDASHRRPGNAFWVRLWGDRTEKLEVRAYSFSDSATSNVIETVVSKASKDPNTSLYLQRVKVGDEIEIRLETGSRKLFINPRKDLELESDDWWPKQKFLFIGLGTGVAPHLSAVRYMACRKMMPSIMFVVSAKTPKRLIFNKELLKISDQFMRFVYLPFITRVNPDDYARSLPQGCDYRYGRPTLSRLKDLIPDISERHVRICGGAGAKETFEEEARALGLKFPSIRAEVW